MALVDVFPFGARVASNAGGGGATTGVENRKLYDGVTGSPAFAAHPDGLAQHSAMRINVLTAHANRVPPLASAPAKLGVGFHVWGVTSPATAAFQYVSWLLSGGARAHLRWNTTGAFQANLTGGTILDAIAAVTTGRLYWIEAYLDVSGTTWLMDVFVDGVYAGQASFAGQVANTISNVTAGNPNASGTSDGYLSDLVVLDYPSPLAPFGECWTFDLVPIASGTHNATAGDFTDDASAAVNVGETTSWAKLDEWPPNTTDFVRQAVARTTSYLEHVFSSMPAGYAARYLSLVAANAPSGTTALEMGIRLAVNGSVSAEAVIDASVATGVLEYHVHGYPLSPSGNPWSPDQISAARPRSGFSNDISPLYNLSALLGQVVAQRPGIPFTRRDWQVFRAL